MNTKMQYTRQVLFAALMMSMHVLFVYASGKSGYIRSGSLGRAHYIQHQAVADSGLSFVSGVNLAQDSIVTRQCDVLAVGSFDGFALFAAQTGQQLSGKNKDTFAAGENGLKSVVWSPDATKVATINDGDGNNKRLIVWDCSDPTAPTIVAQKGDIVDAAQSSWSPDSTQLATVGVDESNSKVVIWDITSDAITDSSAAGLECDFGGARYAAWSPDGTKIVAASDSNIVVFTNNNDGSWTKGDPYTITNSTLVPNVTWSPDSQYILVGYTAGSTDKIQLFSVSDNNLNAEGSGDTVDGTVNAAAFSPDGNTIFYTNSDTIVQTTVARLLSSQVPERTGFLSDLPSNVLSLAVDAAGAYLAVGTDAGHVRVYDITYLDAPTLVNDHTFAGDASCYVDWRPAITTTISEANFSGGTLEVTASTYDASGNQWVAGVDHENGTVFVVKMDARGQVDTAFGTDGVVTFTRSEGRKPEQFIFTDSKIVVLLQDAGADPEFTTIDATTFTVDSDSALGTTDKVLYAQKNNQTGANVDFVLKTSAAITLYEMPATTGSATSQGSFAPSGSDLEGFTFHTAYIDTDGAVWVSGLDTSDQVFVAKFIVNSGQLQLDTEFGTDGVVNIAENPDENIGVLEVKDIRLVSGRVAVSASYPVSNDGQNGLVALVNATDGSLISSFGTSGVETQPFGATYTVHGLQPIGGYLHQNLVKNDAQQSAVMRYQHSLVKTITNDLNFAVDVTVNGELTTISAGQTAEVYYTPDSTEATVTRQGETSPSSTLVLTEDSNESLTIDGTTAPEIAAVTVTIYNQLPVAVTLNDGSDNTIAADGGEYTLQFYGASQAVTLQLDGRDNVDVTISYNDVDSPYVINDSVFAPYTITVYNQTNYDQTYAFEGSTTGTIASAADATLSGYSVGQLTVSFPSNDFDNVTYDISSATLQSLTSVYDENDTTFKVLAGDQTGSVFTKTFTNNVTNDPAITFTLGGQEQTVTDTDLSVLYYNSSDSDQAYNFALAGRTASIQKTVDQADQTVTFANADFETTKTIHNLTNYGLSVAASISTDPGALSVDSTINFTTVFDETVTITDSAGLSLEVTADVTPGGSQGSDLYVYYDENTSGLVASYTNPNLTKKTFTSSLADNNQEGVGVSFRVGGQLHTLGETGGTGVASKDLYYYSSATSPELEFTKSTGAGNPDLTYTETDMSQATIDLQNADFWVVRHIQNKTNFTLYAVAAFAIDASGNQIATVETPIEIAAQTGEVTLYFIQGDGVTIADTENVPRETLDVSVAVNPATGEEFIVVYYDESTNSLTTNVSTSDIDSADPGTVTKTFVYDLANTGTSILFNLGGVQYTLTSSNSPLELLYYAPSGNDIGVTVTRQDTNKTASLTLQAGQDETFTLDDDLFGKITKHFVNKTNYTVEFSNLQDGFNTSDNTDLSAATRTTVSLKTASLPATVSYQVLDGQGNPLPIADGSGGPVTTKTVTFATDNDPGTVSDAERDQFFTLYYDEALGQVEISTPATIVDENSSTDSDPTGLLVKTFDNQSGHDATVSMGSSGQLVVVNQNADFMYYFNSQDAAPATTATGNTDKYKHLVVAGIGDETIVIPRGAFADVSADGSAQAATATITTGNQNRVVLDALIDGNNLVELIGVDPDSSNAMNGFVENGFSSLVIAQFNKTTGASVETDLSLQAGASNELTGLAANTLLQPGAIRKIGSYYYVFGSTRYLDSVDQASQVFVTRLATDGTLDTTWGTNGTRFFAVSGLYSGDGEQYVRIFDAQVMTASNDFPYVAVVGSVIEDPAVTHTSSEQAGFIGVLDILDDANWQIDPVAVTDQLQSLSITGTTQFADDERLFVGGQSATGAHIAAYTIDTNANALVADTTFAQTYNTTDNSANGDGGVWSYGLVGTKVVDLALHEPSNLTAAGLIAVIANPVTYDPVLKESVTVARVLQTTVQAQAGQAAAQVLDTDFAEQGERTYFFDPLPQMAPLNFSLAHPEYAFEHNRLRVQVGQDSELFISGTLTAHGLPFIYKLDKDGNEVEYSKNFKHMVNNNNELVQALVDSPVHYPVIGQHWMGAVHGVYASALDVENNWLYVFGTQGTVDRHIDRDSDAVAELAVSDIARKVTTGNLVVTAKVSDVAMRTFFTEQEIQAQVLDNTGGSVEFTGTEFGGSADITFENLKLYSNPIRHETAGLKSTEVYGTALVSLHSRGAAAPDIDQEPVVLVASGENALIYNVAGGGSDGDFGIYTDFAGVGILNNIQLLQSAGIDVTNLETVIFKDAQDAVVDVLAQDVPVNQTWNVLANIETIESTGTGTTPDLAAVTSALQTFVDTPSLANGAIQGGLLVGTISDGTQVGLVIHRLALNNLESVAVATEITGTAALGLVNQYTDTSYTLSIDNSQVAATAAMSVVGDAGHTVSLQDAKLDLIETPNVGTQMIFGYVELDSSEFGLVTVPVQGQVDLTVTNLKLDGAITAGDVSNPDAPTGSYVSGRSQFGRISLALTNGTHAAYRQALEVHASAKCTLAVESAGSDYVLDFDASSLSNQMLISNNVAFQTGQTLELAETGTRVLKGSGKHSVHVTATLPVAWTNIGKDGDLANSNEGEIIAVGGELSFTVQNDGSVVFPDHITLRGKKDTNPHERVYAYVRLNDFEAASIDN